MRLSPESHPLALLFIEIRATANRLKFTRSGTVPTATLSILQLLDPYPRTVPELARQSVISRQSIQMLVNRLASDGLVTFTPNPAHKKSSLLQLSEAGKALLASAATTESQLHNSFLSGISEAEIASAASLLSNLRQALAKEPSALKPASIARQKFPRKKTKRSPKSNSVAQNSPVSNTQENDLPEGSLPVNLL